MTGDPVEAVTESAKAVSATAEAVSKVVDAASASAKALAPILGPVVKDAIGLAGGDYLRHARMRNEEKLKRRTEELLNSRKVETVQPVSPSIALPLIDAAKDESREELQEIWARLLASTMDPKRSGRVRLALQLQFSVDMGLSCNCLVCPSPKRPCDDVSGLDASLREADGDTADFLKRPPDQCRRGLVV